MKKLLFTLAIICTTILGLNAQNAMFVNHSQDYATLLADFSSRTYVEVTAAAQNEAIEVVSAGATYTYRFNRGWLYEIEMTRTYEAGKVARKALKGCLNYFEASGATPVAVLASEKNHQEMLFSRTGRLFELSYEQQGNGEMAISMTSTLTANRPLLEWKHTGKEAGTAIVQAR